MKEKVCDKGHAINQSSYEVGIEMQVGVGVKEWLICDGEYTQCILTIVLAFLAELSHTPVLLYGSRLCPSQFILGLFGEQHCSRLNCKQTLPFHLFHLLHTI